MNAPLVQNPPEGLRIITATERMAEPRGIKGCIFGRSGVGKTAPVREDPRPRTPDLGAPFAARAAADAHRPDHHTCRLT